MKSVNLKNIASITVVLVMVILCLRQLREPDLWWQIRSGEYIIDHLEVPRTDVFSYTYQGEPWINVKWLTEVGMAGFARVAGPENLMLLQLSVVALIGFFLFRLNRIMNGHHHRAALLLTGLSILIAFSFRMNSRPEMVSHVMTCVFLFLYQKYRKEGGNWILLIIPLQMLWANMHEAFGIGVVMSGIFVLSFVVENRITGQKIPLIKPILVLVLSVAAIGINPNGWKMILHPYNIYSQLGDNQFTTEMLNFTHKSYWTFASVLAALFMSIAVSRLLKNRQTPLIKHLATKFGLGYVGMLLAFFYLGLGSERNTPFLMFIVFPLLSDFWESMVKNEKRVYRIIILVSMALYIMVGSGIFYKIFLPREQYGLMVNPQKNPIGAARFIEAHQLKGKGFTDYLSSSYLLWRLQPDFKSYVDLRDLDVFPEKFMKNVLMAYHNPGIKVQEGKTLWQYMQTSDNFEYVVLLNSPEFKNFHQYLVHHEPDFELVYADPLCSVYLKNTPENKPVIEQLGWATRGTNLLQKCPVEEPNALATVLSNIFWPFFQTTDYSEKQLDKDKRNYFRMIGR